MMTLGAPYAWLLCVEWSLSQIPAPAQTFLPGKIMNQSKTGEFKIFEKLSFDSQDSLKNWEEKIFKGRTDYRVLDSGDTGRFLSAKSAAASSGLYKKIKYEITPELYLSWDWKAMEFPKKNKPKKLADRSQDDFAARVYLIFPGATFFSSNVIEYIWDESLPEGTVMSSPFSDRVKLFVIRSGKPLPDHGGWRREERNIFEDYTALFEVKADRMLQGIALMSDSDNTQTSSGAYFREIEFKVKKNKP